jgi:hypothetical protein
MKKILYIYIKIMINNLIYIINLNILFCKNKCGYIYETQ